VDYDGKIEHRINNKIKIMNFDTKIQINCIVSSYNFTHFITVFGQLYSIGSNRLGQLGLDTKVIEVTVPTLNEYFIDRK
jgi:alpha-tubulin suppressor-like RCC1 family protein